MKTVGELAAVVDGVVTGDETVEIQSIAGLGEAQTGDLSFLSNPKYAAQASASAASAILVSRNWDGESAAVLIRVDDPDAAFAKITGLFVPPEVTYAPGIHASAVIADDATIGADVHVGPNVVVMAGAVIGDRSELLAGCLVGEHAVLGEECRLYGNVTVRENVQIGDRVIVHNNTVIGSDGFGYNVNDDGSRTKVPQVGTVTVGDDTEIGASVCIDRARFGKTRIGKGVKIDNLVQIAHNVVVGDHAVLVAQVGVSGSTVIGPYAILAGQVGVAGHLKIGAGAVVGAQGGVTKNVPEKTYVWGTPAMPMKKFGVNQANVNRLPKLMERIAKLEARLNELED